MNAGRADGRVRRWVVRAELRQWAPVGIGLGSVVAVILLWGVIDLVWHFPTYVLPTPGEVGSTLVADRGTLLPAAITTLTEVLVGFALAVVIGVACAMLIAFSNTLRSVVYPLLVTTQSVPKIAVAPVFLIWFGFGELPKILIVVLLAFFPVVMDTIVGFRMIDPDFIRLARSTQSPSWRTMLKVRVPVALPSFFSGAKMGITFAVIGAVVGEFVAGTSGLGYLVESAQGNQQTALAFASIVVLSVMAVILFYLVELVERLSLRA